jgi:hypothetical protein
MTFHLAQCNIVRLKAPLDSPSVAGFVAALEPINALERVFYLASAPGASTDTITSWPIQAI